MLDQIDSNYLLQEQAKQLHPSIHHYLKWSNGVPLRIEAPPQKIKESGWVIDLQVVCNYKDISIQFEELSYGKLTTDFKKYKGWYMIFDETHYIKNSTSQRGIAALKLPRASTHFVLLVATLASNGWEDAYNYFIILGYYKNKKELNDRHALWETMFLGTRRISKSEGWKDEEVLQEKFNFFTMSISKDDVLDLPP